jgi:hypothetical protein
MTPFIKQYARASGYQIIRKQNIRISGHQEELSGKPKEHPDSPDNLIPTT